MTVSDRIHLLLTRYGNHSITSAEFDELIVWMEGLNEDESDQLLEMYKPLWEQAKMGQLESSGQKVDWRLMLDNIINSTEPEESKKPAYYIGWRAAAAAIIILFSAVALYFMLRTGNGEKPIAHKHEINLLPENVLANVNQTMLTLPDGRQIPLDSIASGNTIGDDKYGIRKLKEGEIAYHTDTVLTAPEYHTVSVPRGGRPYRVALSDGSRILLNAESSLRYPSYFAGNDRLVELTGEGYFEIAPQLRKGYPDHKGATGKTKIPFLVKLDNMTVEVLGTHFNVMSYKDEKSVETTLIEGSVKVVAGSNSVVLTPGKQAQLSAAGILHVTNADTALATAWVNGYFQFNKAGVETIFRQIGRWYDLDVEYDGNASSDLFSGKMERSLPLSGILNLFASSPIKIKLEGKKLIVLTGN